MIYRKTRELERRRRLKLETRASFSQRNDPELAQARQLKNNTKQRRVLIIGTGETARRVASEIAKSSSEQREVIGFIGDGSSSAVSAKRILGDVTDIPDLITEHGINEIIISDLMCWHKRLVENTASQKPGSVEVKVIPTAYEAMLGFLPLTTIDDIPLVALDRQKRGGFYQKFKGVGDKVAAAMLLLLASPVLACAMIATMLSSKGGAIFRQERIGRGGKGFTLYKIRTMVDGAEAVTGPMLSSKHDGRVTLVGRILRNSKLDELPQLVNVLKGQMSLVGPRPERPCFVEEFSAKVSCYRERHRVKPGITGLAQVRGKYSTSADMKIRYDLMYVYNQSLSLDLKILGLTLKAVVREFLPSNEGKKLRLKIRSRKSYCYRTRLGKDCS